MRCYDGTDDLWLATPQKWFEYGEKVTFEDVPAMVNFRSKSLGMTFPLIRFTPQVVKYGSLKSNSVDSDVSTANNGKTTSSNNEDIYSGTDDNGTLVFSDDPSKVKNIHTPNRKKTAKQSNKTSRAQWGINKTTSTDFSNRDNEIISAMEKVAKAMCTSDTTLMKSLMYQPVWEQYEKGIEMDVKKAMKYYHRDCPKSFIVKDVEYNDQENSATLLMDAEVDFDYSNDFHKGGMAALFKDLKGKWKAVFIGSERSN